MKILSIHEKLLFESPDTTLEATLTAAVQAATDLKDVDLRYANFRDGDLKGANLRYVDLRHADLGGADLRYANFRDADLRDANFQDADLRHADLDFSVFPLFCGSFGIKADLRLAAQLAYHFCRIDFDCKEAIAAQKALKSLANKFHRVKECGGIE